MSKNIDEIFKEVRKVANTIALTKAGCVDCRFNNNDLCDDCAKEAFKALTEKELVVPLSEEALFTIIRRYVSAWEIDLVTKSQKDLAKEIYEAQFKEIK